MDSPSLTPLILLVDDQEDTASTIDSILRSKGRVTLRAHTGQQALDLVGKVSPDVVLVDLDLPDVHGIELIRQLHDSPTVYATTPILALSKNKVGRAGRLEVLSAGAWDILTHPVDPNELTLRIGTFVKVKHDADRNRDDGLTDPTTGFYNVRGILRRTKEINADAVRHDRPLTCIAFGIAIPEELGDPGDTFTDPVADALKSVTRVSDTLGKLGPAEFVVLAPGTDETGALRLADRVMEALGTRIGDGLASGVRAGVSAVNNESEASAEDLLLRATVALRRAQNDDGSFRVRSFDA